MLRKYLNICLLFLFVTVYFSCKKSLEPALSKSQIETTRVFSSDISATAAVTGIYNAMLFDNNGYANGNTNSLMSACGLSADEWIDFYRVPQYVEFEQNILLPTNPVIEGLWIRCIKRYMRLMQFWKDCQHR